MEIEVQGLENITELLTTYDYNCEHVEQYALNTVVSSEVSVFNCLRDITAHNILLALDRLDVWFGPEPTLEHCTCLMVLTEYISCAYAEKTLYKTFENALSAKFLKKLFSRLLQEWLKVLLSKTFYQFTSPSEWQSMRRILQDSINRFPPDFRYKPMFDYILNLRKSSQIPTDIRTNLQNGESNPNKFISYKQNSSSQEIKESLSVSHKVISTKPDVKSSFHVSENKRKSNYDMTRYMIRKENLTLEDTKNNKTSTKVVLNAAVDKNKNEVSKLFGNKIQNIDKTVGIQNSNAEQVSSALPKILNAFDVLMRRSGAGLKRKATV